MKIEIIGRFYSEVADYYEWDTEKKFPNFKKLSEQTWQIEAESLKDGERWLAENHPESYMGGNVICENGDFACLAVPCGEYGEGNYETIAARVAYVKRIMGLI